MQMMMMMMIQWTLVWSCTTFSHNKS